jgi:predicted porin
VSRGVLLTTTTLIAAALACGGANAADPIRLTLGGFFQTAAGVEIGGANRAGEPSADRQDGAFKHYVQVWFRGETTLDDGLTLGAQVHLYGDNESAGPIDEVYLYADGAFGRLVFGDAYGPMQTMCITDPGQITRNFGLLNKDSNAFTNVGTNAAAVLQHMITCQNAGQKGTKAVYCSPVFDGFRFAIDYQPSQNVSHGPVTGAAATNGVLHNLVSGALTYEHGFGPVDLHAGGGFEYGIDPAGSGPRPAFYRAGLQLGYGRVALGASGEWWQNYGVSGRANSDSATPIDNGSDAWLATIGGSYDLGLWMLGIEYAHGAFQTARHAADLYNAVSLQATYDVGPGIRLEGEVAYFWYNEDKVATSSTTRFATSNSASIGLGTYTTF